MIKNKNKNGISLITLIIAIVVILILSSTSISILTNTKILDSMGEIQFKNDMKNYDMEIRLEMASKYGIDDDVINQIYTSSSDIEKYSYNLSKSEYLDIAYISYGVLTLKGNKITSEQRKWAKEIRVKIDDESKLKIGTIDITATPTYWTKDEVVASLCYNDFIPNGFNIEYKVGDGNWTKGLVCTVQENNTTVYGRLYNQELDLENDVSSYTVTNIDKENPSIPLNLDTEIALNSITASATGSIDTLSGLKGYQYKINDGDWSISKQEGESYNFTGLNSNTNYTIYARAIDKVGNVSSILTKQNVRTLPNIYQINYNVNGGVGNIPSQNKTEGQNIYLTTTKPTREGYTFLGWSTNSNATSATYQPGVVYSTDSTATLYAVWKANTYTITYNANGGANSPATQNKTYGININITSAIPTKSSHIFLGWSENIAATEATYVSGSTYNENRNITLYAVWQYTTYTIDYNLNGGNGTIDSQVKEYNIALTLSSTVPERKGYNFLGWALTSNATAATYVSGGTYSNNISATLYAVWKFKWPSITNSITFRFNSMWGVSPSTSGSSTTVINSQIFKLYNTFEGAYYATDTYYADIPAGCIVHYEFEFDRYDDTYDDDILIGTGSINVYNNAGNEYFRIAGNCNPDKTCEQCKLPISQNYLDTYGYTYGVWYSWNDFLLTEQQYYSGQLICDADARIMVSTSFGSVKIYVENQVGDICKMYLN